MFDVGGWRLEVGGWMFRMHGDHEPRAVPRRTKSADKSDALQTLRAVSRRPAVAKRLECVRLQRRFPKAGCDSVVARFLERTPAVTRSRLLDRRETGQFGDTRSGLQGRLLGVNREGGGGSRSIGRSQWSRPCLDGLVAGAQRRICDASFLRSSLGSFAFAV